MSTAQQCFRQTTGFFKQSKSRNYKFFKKRLPKILKTNWLNCLIGAVILFGLIFDLVSHLIEKRALAFPNRDSGELIEQNAVDSPVNPNLAVASLIHASMPGVYQTQNPDPLSEDEANQEIDVAISQRVFLLSYFSPITFLRQAPRDKIIEYEVELGDTVSYIAASFGLTTNTVLWANDLNEYSVIRPGNKLIILPVSGVKHKVKQNETISSIAKKYQAQEGKIITFNSLPADGQIQEGQELIVPDGVMPMPAQPRIPSSRLAGYYPRTNATFESGKKSHTYPWGYCTWYVAQRRYIPWSGHAISWLSQARQYGFQTGSTPVAGAIMCTKETPRYGHVAYVESVSSDGKWVTISEMNAPYFGHKTVRTLPVTYPYIRGYIY